LSNPLVEGLVLRIDAKVCHVEVNGRTEKVALRGKLFEGRSKEKRPVAVGDRVLLTHNEMGGAIEKVLPRTTKLARKSAGDDEREQVMATNISLCLIVSSVREPPFQARLVDRIFAGCEREKLPCALVLTKMDRARKKDNADEWIDLYRGLGYTVLPTSITAGKETEASLAELSELLHSNMSVLAGLSGVGKSSLLNHLMPELDLRIGSMSKIRQGKHTTSHTQLIPLPGGGHVLDTPGIRNFGLFGMAPQELTFYYRELATLVSKCAYRDCSHTVEPDCAVSAAFEEGTIAASRFESYLEILTDLQAEVDMEN